MGYSDQFFNALGLDPSNKRDLTAFSRSVDIPSERLNYYNTNNIVPTGRDLQAILKHTGISESLLMLKMGRFNTDLLSVIREHAEDIVELLPAPPTTSAKSKKISPALKTKKGKLYQGDCLETMKSLDDDSFDLIFADPPFNLKKLYPSNINDALKTEKYIHWCETWLSECFRILKPGGSFFLWNLPSWNSTLSNYINGFLTFKHWIAVDIKFSLPISGRLYPSHYSLLYYTKGPKANVFHPDRLAMSTCPKCYGDIKDYGGYKSKMNPKGINLTDVWLDIPPVRHAKYKARQDANELSTKLLDRILEMSSNEGDLVFDPFGGSGTTYVVAELKNRRWAGCEIGPINDIKNRFDRLDDERKILSSYRENFNTLFTPKVRIAREKRGIWTDKTFSS